jgi:hypothetical protein
MILLTMRLYVAPEVICLILGKRSDFINFQKVVKFDIFQTCFSTLQKVVRRSNHFGMTFTLGAFQGQLNPLNSLGSSGASIVSAIKLQVLAL